MISAQPAVTSIILGASKPEQLKDNVASLEINLTAEQLQKLNAASLINPQLPNGFFSPELKQMIFGGKSVEGWR